MFTRSVPHFVLAALALVALATAIGSMPGGPVTAHSAAPVPPDDPVRAGAEAGWSRLQWNFSGRFGVDARRAWGNLVAAGAPGGSGVIVAVLDTGVAFPGSRSGSGSPGLVRTRFVPGYDFVDDDADPFDENGHGTHVASTIAEQTGNGVGVAGLAFGARVMPVRVLDRAGNGDAVTIARGVRYAVRHGAKVINLSLNFDMGVTEPQIPQLVAAIDDAYRRGVLIVAGAGNTSSPAASYPAREPHIVAVGATTEHGCLAAYSNYGSGVDLVAPGGGDDAHVRGDGHCQVGRKGSSISQVTRSARAPGGYGIVGYIGTSMAAPHVSATAALVVASGVVGADPSPETLLLRLERTARDLGAPGRDRLYGWGLLDAGKATAQSWR